MVLLGLLLLAASVGAAVSIAVSNTDSATFDIFGRTVTSLSPGGLMLLGIGLTLAAILGLWLMSAGARRNRRRRQASKHEVEQTRSRVDELEEENVRLREDAAKRHADLADTPTPVPYAAQPADRDYDEERPADMGSSPSSGESRPVQSLDLRGETGIDGNERTTALDGGDRLSSVRGDDAMDIDGTGRQQTNRVFGRPTL